MEHLPGVLHHLEPVLDDYGYYAVGGAIFLEDFGVPLPGETILVLAAVYAGAGRMSITAVVAIGIVAAVLGDNVGYLIGRKAGRPVLARYGKYVLLTPERLDGATNAMTRHGGKIVVVARFVEGLRQANGIVAGIAHMRWLRFLAWNILGAVLWVGTWSAVGYFAGDHLEGILEGVKYAQIPLGVLVVVAIAFYVVRRRRRHRAEDAAEQLETGDVTPEPDAPDA